MKKPFPAYRGDGPYIFVSYAHADAEDVYPEMAVLHDAGYNLWYDEGIEAGTEWREEIAGAISRSRLVLYFITPQSADSDHCKREVNYAIDEQIPLICVYLLPTTLPGGLRLMLSDRQALMKYDMREAEYNTKLLNRVADYLDGQPAGESPEPLKDEQTDLGKSNSVAVLPFHVRGNNDDAISLAEALADEVLDYLSQVDEITTASQASSARFGERDTDPKVVAAQLEVDYLLTGTVQVRGNQARISIRLLRGVEGYQVWSKNHDCELPADFDVQSNIAANISQLVSSNIELDLIERFPQLDYRFKGINPEGTRYGLAAARQALRIETGESGDWALLERNLVRAVEADPAYATGYLALANLHMRRMGSIKQRKAASVAAHDALEKARPLINDETRAEFLLQLGQIYLNLDYNYRDADRAFREATAVAPNTYWADANLAGIAIRENRREDALRHLKTAATGFMTQQHHQRGIFEQSQAFELMLLGLHEQAIEAARRAMQFGLPEAQDNPKTIIAYCLSRLNRPEDAEPYVMRSQTIADMLDLMLHPLEHEEEVFQLLENSVEENQVFVVSLRVWDALEPLRNHPRFRALMRDLEAREIHTDKYVPAPA